MYELELWRRYQKHLCVCPTIGLQLDISRMMFPDGLLEQMTAPMGRALDAMAELECGAEANVDERRMVGHYWLRAAQIAPSEKIRDDIERTIAAVRQFAKDIHGQKIVPERS